ncbi:archaellin/type IV pilin N-terminal domain-containing protein [Halorubellus salinus]|uniref:archaellin/type IV pilin N-terminal domain-containing protein n=1 Tax=Halorubellus salinus TaxID=755309 RepID=UPI001D07C7AF|nr:archaellin/type IV pilin N-terminal domain-containing protein [Halorubellus salinus]
MEGERGQVGIGTLIIFIAMVLVAAVAAGVLINTAGLLEASASDTASDSQAQVSNQITVVSAVGDVDSGNVAELNFTVMKSAGSGDIDLANTTVQYQSDAKAETLSFDTSVGSNSFIVYNTDGDTALTVASDDLVLNETDERKVISIDLSGSGVDDVLAEGDEATVTFVDQSGASTIYGVNVPDTISGESYVAV